MTKGPLTKVFTASLVAQRLHLHCRRPAFRKSLGEGSSYALQYSGLENSMHRGEEQAAGLQSVRHAECLSLPVSSKNRLGSFL